MPNIFVADKTEPTKPDIVMNPNADVPVEKKSNNSGDSFIKALSAFHFMPQDVRFETQIAGESVLLLLRKHWITNLVWIFTSFLLLISPVFIYPFIIYNGLLPSEFPSTYITLIILAWYLGTFSYTLVEFLLWYFTVSIVTDERIIDVDFSNILSKKYSETRIDRIEDVTMKTGGSIRSIFDYGDVIVQTAGEQVQFIFEAVPHPEKVVRLLNELMEKFAHANEVNP